MFRPTLVNVPSFSRRTDVAKLLKRGSVGVELGVAEGMFSEALLNTGRFDHLYSIDMWAGDRGHDAEQYKLALRRLLPHRSRNSVLRLRFDQALDLFPDRFFDFIYVDGYAHTGEEDGETFDAWWPKLKPGGYIAGDDYHDNWPLVKVAVDAFTAKQGLELAVLTPAIVENVWSQFPTWVARKWET